MLNPILTLKRILQESAKVERQDHMVDGVVRQISSAMKVDVCSLYLMTAEEVVLSATVGLAQAAINNIRMRPGQGLVGTIVANQHLLNLENGSQHPAYLYFKESGEEQYQGFLGVPLIFQGSTIGVLVVQVLATRKFSEEEEAFLVTLATHLAGNLGPSQRGKLGKGESADTGEVHVTGIKGAPGIAIAPVMLVVDEKQLDDIDDSDYLGKDVEASRLFEAIEKTLEDFESQSEIGLGDASDTLNALLEVYGMLLKSPELTNDLTAGLEAGLSAAMALKQAFQRQVTYFSTIEDPYLRARSEDFKALASKVYRHVSQDHVHHTVVNAPVILAGRSINVSHLARFDAKFLAGVISTEGSALSHTSVLASALGIPAVMGVDYGVVKRLNQKNVVLDGNQGQVIINPPEPVLSAYMLLQEQAKSLDIDLSVLKQMPSDTRDGVHIVLHSNTGLLADIKPGLERGSQGIGLYRSEIPFMMNTHFPTEDEQIKQYRQILQSYAPLPVTMRTLDVGGDKPLPYFPIHEANPFLGWRGIRFTLDYTNILLEQIRAMIVSSLGTDNLKIMMPMFSREDELTRFIKVIDQAVMQLQTEGHAVVRPKVGVMIEVPSSMWLIKRIVHKIDFISIGSNDLTQYLLAVDRNNARVSDMFDYFHPAVLIAHKMVIQEANRLKLEVSVCGEMAGDPLAVVLLIGMGLTQFSMSAFKLPRIKAIVRHLNAVECRMVLDEVMTKSDEKEIRALLKAFLISCGAERFL